MKAAFSKTAREMFSTKEGKDRALDALIGTGPKTFTVQETGKTYTVSRVTETYAGRQRDVLCSIKRMLLAIKDFFKRIFLRGERV
jgi:hypothetical protein